MLRSGYDPEHMFVATLAIFVPIMLRLFLFRVRSDYAARNMVRHLGRTVELDHAGSVTHNPQHAKVPPDVDSPMLPDRGPRRASTGSYVQR